MTFWVDFIQTDGTIDNSDKTVYPNETHQMKDEDKTKGQLINELEEMRKRIAELEALENKRKQAEEMHS